MKFTKKYDWMYKRMVANLCVGNQERKTFTKWWKELGKMIDAINIATKK